jgi:hypothetical protein
MSDAMESAIPAHDPLDDVIAVYLQQVEAGEVPDRDALLSRHLDLADRMRAYFADCDRLGTARFGFETRAMANGSIRPSAVGTSLAPSS